MLCLCQQSSEIASARLCPTIICICILYPIRAGTTQAENRSCFLEATMSPCRYFSCVIALCAPCCAVGAVRKLPVVLGCRILKPLHPNWETGGQYRESLKISNPPFPRPLPRKNNVTCVADKTSKAGTIVTCVAYTATPKPARALRRCLHGNALPARALGALPSATPKPARALSARAGNAAVGDARDTHVPETHLTLVGKSELKTFLTHELK